MFFLVGLNKGWYVEKVAKQRTAVFWAQGRYCFWWGHCGLRVKLPLWFTGSILDIFRTRDAYIWEMTIPPKMPMQCSINPKPFSFCRGRFLLIDPSCIIPRRLHFLLKCFVCQHLIWATETETAVSTGQSRKSLGTKMVERALSEVNRPDLFQFPSGFFPHHRRSPI